MVLGKNVLCTLCGFTHVEKNSHHKREMCGLSCGLTTNLNIFETSEIFWVIREKSGMWVDTRGYPTGEPLIFGVTGEMKFTLLFAWGIKMHGGTAGPIAKTI